MDEFDEIVLFEESSQKNGYSEGFQIGKERGWKEGYQKGVQVGGKIASEVGYYEGCVSVWLQLLRTGKMPVKPRLQKLLESIQDLLTDFSDFSATDASVQDKLEQIRAKFKHIKTFTDSSPSNKTETLGF